MLALHSAFRALRSALLLSLLATAYCLLPTGAAAQDDPFASGVRTTPWLSPADEQKAFQLPPGFEINLVAAEPDIQKPLNMAFDERGRIWLTNTIEYPYAAPPDRPAQDTIKILEDTDGDGRFEKVTTFADGLNIPMGIYPWKGGCVAFSIPNIWHFEDTDGDGVCDKRTVLYGPFDTTRDTHGMINALRRGWDGWVYACHGFNNDSRVKGTDGHEIHMQSGNVFRFKLDGSRIEHFTHGQVNPFGMCFDEYFNIFTADCHSKPVYQLLRGGYYPSFGKPHDGLGFVPPMMDHLHGSTAICGLVKYSGENFPEEFRGDFYSGNVMTSRINRNKPEYHGSTIKAIEQPDFLSTTDPWFRPVDLQIGPDGAMYILDFYNRIIGHYEVPLPHPGRDRTSGRIWRVSYKSESAVGNALRGVSSATNPRDLTKLTTSELISQLDSPQLEHRLRALNYLVDKQGKTAIPELSAALQSNNSPHARIDARWALERLAALSEPLRVAAVVSNNREEQVHALKLAAERLAFQPVDRDAALAILKSSDGFVSRAAAESLSLHDTDLPPLLDAWTAASSDDNHLNYMIRLAIRRNFRSSLDQAIVTLSQLPDARWRELAPIAAVVNEKMAAEWLFAYLQKFDESDDVVAQYLGQISRHTLSPTHRPGIVEWAKKRAGTDLDRQLQFVNAIASGATRDIRAEVRPWAIEVCEALLTSNNANRIPWTAVPIDNLPPSESPWVVTPRASRDGDKDSLFFSSLPRGEQRTGIYRSAAFDLPAELSFWCSGHSGRPPAPLNDANYIRLRDAQTHEILAESRPPRNDTARLITWKRGAGLWPAMSPRRGYIELIDADTANAYAWFAVGRFSLPALNPSDAPQKQQLAAEIIGKLKLDSLKPQLVSLVAAPNTDSTARTAIAQALLAFAPDARASTLTAALSDAQLPDDLRPKIGAAVATRDSATLLDCLRDVLKRSPLRLQTTLAQTLAGDVPGADALLTLIEAGQAAPRLLLLPAVNNKLTALKNADLDARSTAITSKLPPADAVLDALITDRRRAFAQAKTNIERGQTVFTKHCASCHKIADKGNLIGPQLDGIGSRGLDRLLEDILDPNRNVDIAFRTTTLRLSDGRVLSGLHRREEGTQLILADNQGKEFSIAKSEIDEQKKTPLSLMPANVLEIVPPDEFADLIAYLLNQRAPTNK